MRHLLCSLCIAFVSISVSAASLSDEACERLLTMAETEENPSIYDDCDFGNELKAWSTWAPFAAAHDMKRALFELCKRYPDHQYGALYCEKAIRLNYGPALAHLGYRSLEKAQFDDAFDYFNQAVKAGDLPEQESMKIMETLGELYLREDFSHYAPRSGIALLTKAANRRSAVANNALGYLVYSGKNGVKKDHQKALEFIWRAILYGCPAAEENLGVFHLARQGKITEDDATYYMSLQAFTCKPFDKNFQPDASTINCNCADIRSQDAYFKKQPYLFVTLKNENVAVIRTPNGEEKDISVNDSLPDGSIVREIRPTLLTLTRDGEKIFINRYHRGRCVDECLKPAATPKRRPVAVRPYHLTFSKRECADIAYYANRLIDTNQPYVGRRECLGEEMDETTKMLLDLK